MDTVTSNIPAEEDDVTKFNHGVMAISTDHDEDRGVVLHVVLFLEPPPFEAYMALYDELDDNPDFGMDGLHRYEDFILVPAPEDIVERTKNRVLEKDENTLVKYDNLNSGKKETLN